MRVLIATDLSGQADLALRQGVAMASLPGDSVAVVHAIPSMAREGFFHLHDDMREARTKQIVERATAALEDRVAPIVPRGTELFVDEGVDYASILLRAETWHADVIVVAPAGRGGSGFGSVAKKVTRHAHCSVLVARPGSDGGGVLAATDLSDSSLAALEVAAAEAKRRGVKLKVVQSIGFLDIEAYYLLELATPSITKERPERSRILQMMHDALGTLGATGECELLETPPAGAVVHEAESFKAGLIVVGMRGRTGLARLGLGGVAEKVVREAHCSVLVVRQGRPKTVSAA